MSRGRPQNVLSFGPRDVPQLGPVDVLWTSLFRTFEYFFFSKKTVIDLQNKDYCI